MKIVYMYHDDEPKRGSLQHGSLPEPEVALKPIKPLLILQRPKFERLEMKNDETIETFDVSMKNVSISPSNATKMCTIVRLMANKQGQIVAWRPIFEPSFARNYIMHMIVYECKQFESEIHDEDDTCALFTNLNCTNIVATWSKGSQGFVFPNNVGYPLDTKTAANIYFLQTYYEPYKSIGKVFDNSGLRFSYTTARKHNTAGLLSIGIQPVWTHVIPPGFRKVTSIGYCTGEANKNIFPTDGITVVGIQMQAHEMGQSIKVRLVRNGKELPPIAQDHSLDSNYLEYRSVAKGVKILPGDDIMVECSYDSYEKSKLTLGGYEAQQEICQATLVYYPKQEHMSSCQSKAKTRNFLKSLNIEKLKNSPSFTIELPEKYAGRTLEEHLKNYDWKTEFDHFERISKTSPFDIICMGSQRKVSVHTRRTFPLSLSYCAKTRRSCGRKKIFIY
jgi:Copper type II ascorbate-dependent monooxygenase, C-terminal domain/Copper type II ascorbate-dependent monooxygenase, N-terminal domain